MNSYCVRAHHPHWRGTLRLWPESHSVRHVETGSTGTYQVSGNTLTVIWDDYKPDKFVKEIFGVYVHEKVTPVSANALRTVEIAGQVRELSRISIPVSASGDEVNLRLGTTDVQTFGQVFVSNEYDSKNLPDQAEMIVDLGANVGYATVFFALRYPEARILAIEPDGDNFAALVGNTRRLGRRIQSERAAVWIKDDWLTLQTEDLDGKPMGAWGIRVSDRGGSAEMTVPCWKLSTLYEKYDLPKVDILKIDIEGSELELFNHEPDEWLTRTDLIIIETHDRFRPGSELAVRKALLRSFQELPRSGENLFFRRSV